MATHETELSPDSIDDSSYTLPFDQITSSSKFMIIEKGLDPVDQEEGSRTNIWTPSPSIKKRNKTFQTVFEKQEDRQRKILEGVNKVISFKQKIS